MRTKANVPFLMTEAYALINLSSIYQACVDCKRTKNPQAEEIRVVSNEESR
jgi:hypothetical protein